MGISKHRCEQCGTRFYIGNGNFNWKDGNDSGAKLQAELSGMSEGTYNSRFCCKSCAKEWSEAHPGKSTRTFGERFMLFIILAPIKVPWFVCKQIFKIVKPILKSKWTWTILTCGMSYVTWKMLNALYAPKK